MVRAAFVHEKNAQDKHCAIPVPLHKASGMKTPLILRYFIWSMLIFAVSMILLSVRGLHTLELRSIEFGSQRRFAFENHPFNGVDVPAMMLPVYERLSQEQFLQTARDITHKLRKAGAKVVIIPLLEYIRPTEKNRQCLREILSDSIAIFGVETRANPFLLTGAFRLEDRENWWVRHPFYRQMNIPWGVISESGPNFSPLIRFVPTGMRDFDSGDPVPDVNVLALKRYFDIPDNEVMPVLSSRLQVGAYAFPIERDGLTYLRYQVMNRQWTSVYASLASNSDSVTYFPEGSNRPQEKRTLEQSWEAHKGKIVFIDWYGAGEYRMISRGWISMQILNAFFNRSFVRVHNEWNVLLITTLVILLSVVSYSVRNGLMVFLSLVLSAGAIAISAWLFTSYAILFEPVYCIVPILLCGFLLPVVKANGLKRIAEEKIKSLEAENRRLLDLQKSAHHGTGF